MPDLLRQDFFLLKQGQVYGILLPGFGRQEGLDFLQGKGICFEAADQQHGFKLLDGIVAIAVFGIDLARLQQPYFCIIPKRLGRHLANI